MKAAIVRDFEHAPTCGEIEAPQARDGEVLVRVAGAAISQLVRAQASGKHYSSGKTLPMVPGADGVGRLADGSRVYFAFPRAPIGAMAECSAVAAGQCVALPDDIDDVTAAAIANPGMSSWAALELRAGFRPGESVLVNGAAGSSGRLAIQIARHLGASRVIATARKPQVESELRALGADDFICLDQPGERLVAAFRERLHGAGVEVVLDYLWGQPAACIIDAAAGHGGSRAQPRVRFVNIGSLAGASLPIAAGTLRSSGLELTGSGLGSVSHAALVGIVGKLLRAVGPARLTIDAIGVPLRDVESAWRMAADGKRIVLRP
ncbi:quinone oxidoreductase family protein [Solimonas terrae]|uniref:Zinc-binding alcohol dehydrogenase family protein n=1 Tax=Solimonas terrae TaxID=1396819 RepID=A0A6M2BPC1_9GAMM|nr:zinc-binding alcohol dehydrogenase family protein [Solimonas terrae]NGY03907.1 zinc-binding alcohol dehydrogenase family protein [Solimonas terrae]